MQANDTVSATQLLSAVPGVQVTKAHVTFPQTVTGPISDDEVIVTAPEGSGVPTAACGGAVCISAWVTLILNLLNVVAMMVACYELNAYLHAPHPDDDAYAIAAVAYLIFVPSLVDSALICLFTAYILYSVYHGYGMEGGHADGDSARRASHARWWWYVGICVLLFLLSCWPAGVGVALLGPQIQDGSSFTLDSAGFINILWVVVSVSFAVFAVLLCTHCRPHRRE